MHIAVIGASSEIGKSLIDQLLQQDNTDVVYAVSRKPQPGHLSAEKLTWIQLSGDWSDAIDTLAESWHSAGVQLDEVWSMVGWLHDEEAQPERRLESLNENQLLDYFRVNAVYPTLLLKSFKPLLPSKRSARVIQLGAKVGSIEDNKLGGWYGYRASKAALNMLWRTAAIEFRRTHKQLVLGVIHPGTTDSPLSKPFQKRIPKGKLYTPEQTAQRMLNVGRNLKPAQSGEFWFWDGKRLPW